MWRLSWLPAVLIVTACGGGSGAAPSSALPTGRADHARYGFYGDAAAAETESFADTAFVFGWPDGSVATTVAHTCEAQRAGQGVVLGVDWRHLDTAAFVVESLRQAGCLPAVIASYPEDEPDLERADRPAMSDGEVLELVRLTRSLLPGVPVWVLYSSSGNLPGLCAFDAVGRDRYGAGPQSLPLCPGQRLLVIAGCAYFEDPTPYVVFTQQHPEVIAMLVFLWVWPPSAPGLGCRDNGLAGTYAAAGRQVLGR